MGNLSPLHFNLSLLRCEMALQEFWVSLFRNMNLYEEALPLCYFTKTSGCFLVTTFPVPLCQPSFHDI